MSDGHVAPAEQRLPFFLDDPRDEFLDRVAVALVARQKDQAGAVRARGGSVKGTTFRRNLSGI